MELVSTNITYRIRLPGTGEEVVMSGDVWLYFRTLHEMIQSCGDDDDDVTSGYGCVVEIPVAENSGIEITASLLQAMIDFYSLYIVSGDVVTAATIPTRDTWMRILMDEESLVRLVKAADYLHTSELLVFVIDHLYNDLRRQSFSYLEKRVSSITKRKREDKNDEDQWRTLRLQYRREQHIKRIMESILPDNKFVRGIDRRIRKYVNPIIVSHGYDKTVVLQYGKDSVLIDDKYWSDLATTDRSILALIRAREAVRKHGHNEMVAGVLFYALLSESGLLTVYSEEGVIFDEPTREKPLGNQSVIAIWAGLQHLFALTHDALYVLGDGEMYQVEGIDASTVIEVSVGAQHALILTNNGVYGWGNNRFNQLGLGYTPPERGVVRIGYEVTQDSATAVLSRDDHSIILMSGQDKDLPRRPKMIGTGTKSLSERSAMGFDRAWGLVPEWKDIPLYVPGDARLSGGGDNTILYDEFSIYSASIEIPWLEGEAFYYRDYVSMLEGGGYIEIEVPKENATFLADKDSLYVARIIAPGLLERLGGTDSTTEPYKLKLPFGRESTLTIDQEKERPVKRGRFGCQLCGAKAKLVDTKEAVFFCSRYCFHKEIIANK